MQLVDSLVFSKPEKITTFVTFRKVLGVTSGSMERLVNITYIMDQQTKVKTLCEHEANTAILVSKRRNGCWLLDKLKGVNHLLNGPSNVIFLSLDTVSIIKVIGKYWCVCIMPVALVYETCILDDIGKGCTLDKWVIFLISDKRS